MLLIALTKREDKHVTGAMGIYERGTKIELDPFSGPLL